MKVKSNLEIEVVISDESPELCGHRNCDFYNESCEYGCTCSLFRKDLIGDNNPEDTSDYPDEPLYLNVKRCPQCIEQFKV